MDLKKSLPKKWYIKVVNISKEYKSENLVASENV